MRTTLTALTTGLIVATPAFAQSDEPEPQVQGSVSLGALHDSEDSRDPAKLREYRDLSNGVLSGVFAGGRIGRYWFDGFAENLGRDDWGAALRGGEYDVFKYRLYGEALAHNFVFNARTPYAGTGGANLTALFPRLDPDTWNVADLGYRRRDVGGMFEWQSSSPWHLRVDANQVRSQGTKLGSAANGTSPGNGFVDLAIPVRYKTSNVSVEGGYATRAMDASLSWTTSRFANDVEELRWSNPFWASGTDTTFLAPDNLSHRLAATATFRRLPFGSTFAARYTWSELKSDTMLATQALNGIGTDAIGLTHPNVANFEGRVRNQTVTLALASTPALRLDTRLYYNYYERQNDSTRVEYNAVTGLACGTVPGTTLPGPCENELFGYRKNNVGFDAHYRINRGNRIGGGIDYLDMHRGRSDYDDTTDKRLFFEWKNTSLDDVSARIKYTYLERRSNFLLSSAGANSTDPLYLERFVARYDASSLDRNEVKLFVDWSPAAGLDLSLEGILKDNRYPGTVLGRSRDRRDEVYLSASFGDPAKWRVSLFADLERVKYDSYHRSIANLTAAGAYDPAAAPDASNYNYSATNKDTNWAIGAGVDWPATERLLLKASFLYYRTDGSADIVSQNNFGNPLPINAYDNTRKTSLNLKGIYQASKRWSVTAGYAYEMYRYSDDQYNGYQSLIPAAANATSYLNGYGAFIPYTAHIVYALATYRF